MRTFGLILLLLGGAVSFSRADLSPDSVAILYNSKVPESKKLAETYRLARAIPEDNLIPLDMPTTEIISREEYDRSILKPLRRHFEMQGWWRRQKDAGGTTLPVENEIRVLVTMKGVPLKIKPTPKPAPKPGAVPAPPPADPMADRDDASVDSELSMFGVEELPTLGPLQNKYFQETKSISVLPLPFLVLTARIDAPTYATCERMIRDAVEVEKTGLWGRAYVDIANKYPLGDQWMEAVIKSDREAGIPTVVDRFDDTLPKNYPMTDAAFYYGWYDWHVSGPFLNERFRFKKGAVALHLHSFSADQLTMGGRNWSGPLLERGAAVTVGNVYEPYLQMTHDYGILNQRLMQGFTWVEACWMSIPVTSWQSVILGDPLYRPMIHLDGSGVKEENSIEYRALRAAAVEWKDNPRERQIQIEKAAERMKSGTLAEAAGLELLEQKDTVKATNLFRTAKGFFVKTEDKLRQDFHVIAIDRGASRKPEAIRRLREANGVYGGLPEASALKGWLDILDPPPPPPADPTKGPAVKKP